MFELKHETGSELWCNQLSAEINRLINIDSVVEYGQQERRTHLGASEIGHPCARKIWYGFRWTKLQIFPGQMYRLFQRGHDEEPRIIHRLSRIGIVASDRDPSTGKQHRITNEFNRHFGGSLDSLISFLWSGMNLPPMIGEFKTHNDKSFAKHAKEGVRSAKPQHYTQMNVYGRRYGYHFGLYVPVNKNNDEIKVEVVRLDHKLGESYEERAVNIIQAQEPPRRISERDTHKECMSCDFKMICHYSAPIEKNCRSCANAVAIADGTWYCNAFIGTIPDNYIPHGCDYWTPIV